MLLLDGTDNVSSDTNEKLLVEDSVLDTSPFTTTISVPPRVRYELLLLQDLISLIMTL